MMPHPNSLISEQFRSIITNIKFAKNGNGIKSILITSSKNKEGKSTIASNLAISMAQQEEKVLVIDANVKNPNLHKIFNTSNNIGLVDVLLDESLPIEEIISKTGIAQLDVLTSGIEKLNAIESGNIQKLLNTLYEIYDVIIIDCPSISEVTTIKTLAHYCEGILLVFNKGATHIKDAIETTKNLFFVEEKIIGAILNDNSQFIIKKLLNRKAKFF